MKIWGLTKKKQETLRPFDGIQKLRNHLAEQLFVLFGTAPEPFLAHQHNQQRLQQTVDAEGSHDVSVAIEELAQGVVSPLILEKTKAFLNQPDKAAKRIS